MSSSYFSDLDESTEQEPKGSYFSDMPSDRGAAEKSLRVGAQYGLGLLDRAALPYTVMAQMFGSKGARVIQAQKGMRREFERLSDLLQSGQGSEQDQQQLEELQTLMNNPEMYMDQIQAVDRTPSGLIKQGIEKVTGYDLQPEGALEKTGEFLGSFTPKDLVKGAQAVPKVIKALRTKTKELLPSGLSKPRAMDSKIAPYTTIGKETQKKAIEKLNIEAGGLAKEKVLEHMPIVKQIEQGFDFKNFFSTRMGNLEKVAARSKARVDLSPVEELMEKTAQKYRGIPNLHSDAKKIATEVRAFYKKPPLTVDKALKTYRSNNRKLDQIFETSRLKGTQKEYVDFLVSQNKAIAQSFRGSFGENNRWVRDFERLNAGFKQHVNAQKTLKELDGFFGGRLTPRSLEKLGSDPRTQQKLSMMMGEEGAKEIGQLAKDLKAATESIKKISTAKLWKYEGALPFTYIIPGIGKATGTLGGILVARNLLGTILSKPAYRRAYGEALKALSMDDLESYKTAAAVLIKMIKKSEEEND